MKITRMKTNRITNPLGFDLGNPRLSWVTICGAKKQDAAQVLVAADAGFDKIVHDSGKRSDISCLAYTLDMELRPSTRYYWKVFVWADDGQNVESEVAWFETAKLNEQWHAKWITPDFEGLPLLRHEFELNKNIAEARVYVSGLGLYELYINGKRCQYEGQTEYLTPFCNAYDKWIQYQSYDITGLLKNGENAAGVMLGDGWYKGRFGFYKNDGNLFGDKFAFICEIVVKYEDGSEECIVTDTNWKSYTSPVVSGNIYDGEVYDANLEQKSFSEPQYDDSKWNSVSEIGIGYERLTARKSLPVIVKEKLTPIALIHTPIGETVLDMGQNMVGWLSLIVKEEKGKEIKISYGEVMQNGCFYRDNYRTAKSEHTFISDGNEALIEPHFTFFGFRYVKIEGLSDILTRDLASFAGNVVYSDLESVGEFECSNEYINRLYKNAFWGQKGNFLDVPTDCPQRDERMGWTGDTQMFSGTACYNMDSYAFFNKWLYDLSREQEKFGGSVPFVVPSINMKETDHGSSAWADAATIVPWNVYLHYGDKSILERQFESMCGWVEYIKKQDDANGSKRLFTTGYHYGDWLALDGEDEKHKNPFGGTDTKFISSAFYCYSARLTAKAAKVIGKNTEADYYNKLADEIRAAIESEFLQTREDGGKMDTQTAHVLTLFMDLADGGLRDIALERLLVKLEQYHNHLCTGFVGTPYLCRILSDNGYNDLSYNLLLNEDFPSWIYEVKLGATTIWERWNSLEPDGTVSDTGMNSFNHYAYGSVVEWMMRNMCGLKPCEDVPGFKRAVIKPQPSIKYKDKINFVKTKIDTASGEYFVGWRFEGDNTLSVDVTIPFDCTALLTLPLCDKENIELSSGCYHYEYQI